jgi:hypothetical protein
MKYKILKDILEAVDSRKYSQMTIDTMDSLLRGDWNGGAAIYEIRNLYEVMRSDILDYEFWDAILTIMDSL